MSIINQKYYGYDISLNISFLSQKKMDCPSGQSVIGQCFREISGSDVAFFGRVTEDDDVLLSGVLVDLLDVVLDEDLGSLLGVT